MKISTDSQYREYKKAVEVLIEKGTKLGDMELLSGYKKRMDVENIKQKEAVQKLGRADSSITHPYYSLYFSIPMTFSLYFLVPSTRFPLSCHLI